MKKKICVVINSRANYGRIKTFINEIKNNSKLDLKILVSASAMLYRFGQVFKTIEKDGFKIDKKIYSIVEGDNLTTMAKSTGLSITELSTYFENSRPDIVVVIADRFENLAVAIAASYMNIPVAHIQGGEVTGSIDEKVRHAITKLSNIHFVSTERAKKFVINMGEDPKTVFKTGCPSIDIAKKFSKKTSDKQIDKILLHKGDEGFYFKNRKFIVVLQHPVTTEFTEIYNQIKGTLDAVVELKKKKINVVWLWPNVDAGSDELSKQIRIANVKSRIPHVKLYKNFTPENYIRLINNSLCIIGNSSSGIRESSYLGVPCVNIGSRQANREKSKNVIDVSYSKKEIINALNYHLKKGRYKKDILYGNGEAGKKIASIISKKKLSIEKKLNYLK